MTVGRNDMNDRFRLGLLINPLAGIGGETALKGSDGVADQALAKGGRLRATERVRQTLESLLDWRDRLLVRAAPGPMGADLALDMGFSVEVCGSLPAAHTSAEDTERCAARLVEAGVDLLLFAGGDGTARNICNSVSATQLVLGVP